MAKITLIVGFLALFWCVFDGVSSGDYIASAGFIATLLILPIFMFPCRYVLCDEYFVVQAGVIKLRRAYDDIEDVEIMKHPFRRKALSALNVAFSFRVVFIAFKSRKWAITISPKNEEEFIRELNERRGVSQ
jgi:Protein of unknown function (DUF1200).